jgi:hypothetical protein|tara:strand:- start:33510 stop:33725 length:216 start_codon:yes stop_codon:yes gene_type:complete
MKYKFENGTVEYVHFPKEKLWRVYPQDVRYYNDNKELIKEIFAELKRMGMEYGPLLQTKNPPYIIAWEVKE